ncbi:PQQ-dependent sugar dehydrogenase [Thalassotalea agarivorans]|uniref:Glucose/arabinose dehydrogenase, beta-propeller fold n=1 Tax=Thalassotalea agarivorans TaxID=349064 RepID=A0A1H9Y806_THASX|nr:PQQ-dependent sugar dehydrogenase [Thalassotalea agarivorans]SES64509.1 Glucose/arabinose dehydrogenase, beta-propeller fold [Thalassotalea agarivorans]
MKHLLSALGLSLTFFACASDYDKASSLNITAKSVDFADGFTIPWGIAQLPDGNLLVTERQGSLYFVDKATRKKTEVKGVPEVFAKSQGGLLDIKLHPNYRKNGWIYITYSSPEGKEKGGHTALMRAKLDRQSLSLSDQTVLYKGEGNTDNGRHFGSRIAFDNEGFVYFSIGDRGNRDVLPQDLTLDGGKVYRLHEDGKVPADNPFVNVKDAKPAIYSYGHRNPQGLVKNALTGKIWSHEHGPRGGDEVNVIEKGANYGWPVVSYGVNYSGTSFTDLTEKEGMTNPVLYWDPSIAPSGMIHVTSDRYPQLKGKFLLGSMKFSFLSALEVDGDKVVKQYKVLQGIGRVRSLHQGADGYIYVGIDGYGIKRLEP